MQLWIKIPNLLYLPTPILHIDNKFTLTTNNPILGGVTTFVYICQFILINPAVTVSFQQASITTSWDYVSCAFNTNPYKGRITVNSNITYDALPTQTSSFPTLPFVTIPLITAGSQIKYSMKNLKIWSVYRSVNQIFADRSNNHYNMFSTLLNMLVKFDTNCDQIGLQCDTNYLTNQGVSDATFPFGLNMQYKKQSYHLAITGSLPQIVEFVVPNKLWYLAGEEFSLQVYVKFIGWTGQDNCFLQVRDLLWLTLLNSGYVQGDIYNSVSMHNATVKVSGFNSSSWNFITLQKLPGNRITLSVNSLFNVLSDDVNALT